MEPTAPRWTTQADAAGSQMTLKPRIFAVTEKKKKEWILLRQVHEVANVLLLRGN